MVVHKWAVQLAGDTLATKTIFPGLSAKTIKERESSKDINAVA